jgi:hypothetical protein
MFAMVLLGFFQILEHSTVSGDDFVAIRFPHEGARILCCVS